MAFSIQRIKVDGVDIFYREAGSPTAPVVLLLHGFPTSSFQYRNLIPRLASKYRVLVGQAAIVYLVSIADVSQAPDFPGYGFTGKSLCSCRGTFLNNVRCAPRTQVQLHFREFGQDHGGIYRCLEHQQIRDVHF